MQEELEVLGVWASQRGLAGLPARQETQAVFVVQTLMGSSDPEWAEPWEGVWVLLARQRSPGATDGGRYTIPPHPLRRR